MSITTQAVSSFSLLGMALGLSIAILIMEIKEYSIRKKRKEFMKKLTDSDFRLCQEFYDEIR